MLYAEKSDDIITAYRLTDTIDILLRLYAYSFGLVLPACRYKIRFPHYLNTSYPVRYDIFCKALRDKTKRSYAMCLNDARDF